MALVRGADRFEKLGGYGPPMTGHAGSIPNPALSVTQAPLVGPLRYPPERRRVGVRTQVSRCDNAFVGIGCRRNDSSR